MRHSVSTVAAVLAMAGVLAAAAPAAADGPLAPGQTRTVVLPVPDTWADEAASVTATVSDLVQAENGCLEPEADAGDDCSSAVGELGGKLTTALAWGRTDGDGCAPGAEPVGLDLFGAPARLSGVVEVDCLVLEMTFPDGDADNIAQSDGVTFDLQLVASGLLDPDEPDPDVTGGADADAGAPQGPAGDEPGSAGDEPAGQDAGAAVGRGANVPVIDGQNAAGRGAGTVAAPAPGNPATRPGERSPAGQVLDRVDARIQVGGEGVVVQTQADDAALRASLLGWGGLLLGAVTLGWVACWMVLRRRRRAEVAA